MTTSGGFSLVELSIVLVILGLLVGGVLTGQSLIRAAEMRAVGTEFSRYQSAVHVFKDKYFALPGDMPNATQFWGATNAAPATCRTTASTGTSTCNGNGDGFIITSAGFGDEWFYAWKHLANAGLIEGSYTNIVGPGGQYDSIPGVNVPKSRLSSGIWAITYFTYDNVQTVWFPAQENVMSFGAYSIPTSWPQYPILTTEEAWNIDSKLDDGIAGSGKIKAHKNTSGYIPNCANSALSTAAYNLTLTGTRCSLIFSLGL